MADKKSDLRVVRTRNALRAAFEELIAETTLDKITVKALTDRAGINRKTFYLHYETIEAFYDEIMNGIMDEFFEYYEKTPDDPWDMDGHARRFFRYLAAQPPMIEQLVCSPSFYDFGERIYATQMNRYRAFADELFWREGITSESEELICALIRNMALECYRQWVRAGKVVPMEEAAQILGSMTLHSVETHEPPARERLEQRHLVGVGGTTGGSGFFLGFQRHGRVTSEQVAGGGGTIQPRQGFRRRQREGHAAVNAPHHGVGLAGDQHEAVAQTQSRQQKRRTARHRSDARPGNEPAGQSAGKQHDGSDAQKDQRGAVVALNVDGRHRQQNMHQKPQQVERAVDFAPHPFQMPGKGQHKADLGQLRGLEGHAAHTVPAVIGGAARVITDGQEPCPVIMQNKVGATSPHATTACSGQARARVR